MKLFAITKRGSRKDFYDMYVLCNEFAVSHLIDNFSKKYG
jgi:hypothetical protein